jgi:hypothetical protein
MLAEGEALFELPGVSVHLRLFIPKSGHFDLFPFIVSAQG